MNYEKVKRVEEAVVGLLGDVSVGGEEYKRLYGVLVMCREFAQAADLEAPAVEYPREGLVVDGEPEGDGIGDERAPWE